MSLDEWRFWSGESEWPGSSWRRNMPPPLPNDAAAAAPQQGCRRILLRLKAAGLNIPDVAGDAPWRRWWLGGRHRRIRVAERSMVGRY